MRGDCGQMATHPGDIYRLCVEGVLHGRYLMLQEGSLWVPLDGVPADLPDGKVFSEVVTDTHNHFGPILADFDEFLQMPQPASFDGVIAQLETMLSNLAISIFVDPATSTSASPNGADAQIEGIKDGTRDWRGAAADAFNSNVVNRLQDVTGGIFALVWTLLCAARAERKIWEMAWHEVDRIAHDTIDILEHRQSLRDKPDLSFFNALLTVGSYIPGVGQAIEVFTSAVGLIEALAVLSPEDDLCTYAEPDPVVESMRSRLAALKEEVSTQEDKVARGVAAVLSHSLSVDPDAFEMPVPGELSPSAVSADPGWLE